MVRRLRYACLKRKFPVIPKLTWRIFSVSVTPKQPDFRR